MTSHSFTFDKNKTLQALRYHFISRKEIKIMIVLVNVFAIGSAVLFFFKMVSPFAFLASSILWFALMIAFWYLLPRMVYRRASTFKEKLKVYFGSQSLTIENDRGDQSWEWSKFSSWMESPHFFHLYFNPRSFFIIPKSAFDEPDVPEARKILKAMIVGKKNA